MRVFLRDFLRVFLRVFFRVFFEIFCEIFCEFFCEIFCEFFASFFASFFARFFASFFASFYASFFVRFFANFFLFLSQIRKKRLLCRNTRKSSINCTVSSLNYRKSLRISNIQSRSCTMIKTKLIKSKKKQELERRVLNECSFQPEILKKPKFLHISSNYSDFETLQRRISLENREKNQKIKEIKQYFFSFFLKKNMIFKEKKR